MPADGPEPHRDPGQRRCEAPVALAPNPHRKSGDRIVGIAPGSRIEAIPAIGVPRDDDDLVMPEVLQKPPKDDARPDGTDRTCFRDDQHGRTRPSARGHDAPAAGRSVRTWS